MIAPAHFNHRAALAVVGVTLAIAGGPAAMAGPLPCVATTSPEHRAAIAAADAWLAGRWQHASGSWIAAYQLKPAPAMPLGIGGFKNASALTGEPAPVASGPINGVAVVSKVTCTTYEINAGETRSAPSFIVRYSGGALTFNENNEGWSRPLRSALLHVLEVRAGGGDGAPMAIAPMPEARTALTPDAVLKPPSAAIVTGSLGAKQKR